MKKLFSNNLKGTTLMAFFLLSFFFCVNSVQAQGTIAYTKTLTAADSSWSYTIDYSARTGSITQLKGGVTWSGWIYTKAGTNRVATFNHRIKNQQDDLLTSHELGTATSASDTTEYEWPMAQQTWWTYGKGGRFSGYMSAMGAGDTVIVKTVIDWK